MYNVKDEQSLKSFPEAKYKIVLHSNKDAHKFSKDFEWLIFEDRGDYGPISMLKQSDLFDPEKGYIEVIIFSSKISYRGYIFVNKLRKENFRCRVCSDLINCSSRPCLQGCKGRQTNFSNFVKIYYNF